MRNSSRCAALSCDVDDSSVKNHKTRLSCAFQLSGGFPVLERSLMLSAIWAAIWSHVSGMKIAVAPEDLAPVEI